MFVNFIFPQPFPLRITTVVPSDQPKVALDMIKNFVNGGEF